MGRRAAKHILFYAVLIGAWQLLIVARIWPTYIFPSPFQVFETLGSGIADLTFLKAVAVSLRRIALGYGISIVIGGSLGLAMSRSRFLEETAGGLILGLQTLPSICWLPLSLLWFGLNETAVIFVVIMGAVFSITIATLSGIKSVPPLYITAGINMGARHRRLFSDVIVPAALPSVIAGLKQGWSFAWRSLMAGELLFANLGLGYVLTMGRELNDMSQVIAVMIVIACISILIDKMVFGRIEHAVLKKRGLAK